MSQPAWHYTKQTDPHDTAWTSASAKAQSYPTEALRDAFWRGYSDGRATGEDSLHVITPFDVDEQADLYEAWQEGVDAS